LKKSDVGTKPFEILCVQLNDLDLAIRRHDSECLCSLSNNCLGFLKLSLE
jgi:hypothetical protein